MTVKSEDQNAGGSGVYGANPDDADLIIRWRING